ncbi:MAG: hypothetical protein FJ265_10020 [Planctomycetes bacterium]|nr:hypothetical protein [Planctomycetota bacterium]
MQVGQFPASAATSLIEGYCDDFVSLAAVLAQTLEQVSIRGIKLEPSRRHLERLEHGMREMAEAIRELLASGRVSSDFEVALGRPKKEPPPAAPAPAAPRPQPPPPPVPPVQRLQAQAPNPARGPGSQPPPRASQTQPHRPAVAPPRSPAPQPPAPRAAAPTQRPAPAAPQPPAPAPHAARAPAAASPMQVAFLALERDRRTGTLYVQASRETIAFEFVDGCIVHSASDGLVADERLGDLLVELGACTRERLAGTFARLAPEEGQLLGEAIVRDGVATNLQVIAALELQVQKRVCRACTSPHVHFDFAEGELRPEDGRVRIAPSTCLRKAATG